MKRFLHSWVINTFAVLVAVSLLPRGIEYKGPLDLFVASLLLGVLNAVLRPVLMFLTFPILIVTLGLFRFVINAVLLLLVGYLLRPPHFWVHGFWATFWAALIISIVSSILNVLTGGSRVRVQRRRPPDSRDDGDGPVIDV